MRLILIRHAIAVDRSPDIPDDARPLTQEGRKRFRQAARGLARLFPTPDLLLSSPLLRARQTARIASRAWRLPVTDEDALGGGSVLRGIFESKAGLVSNQPGVVSGTNLQSS